MAKAKPITTMIVGLGRIGWQHHIREAAKSPHFEVTAAVDTLADRRKEAGKLYGCATFATIEEALKADLAELAVICTRSIDHCEHSLKAFRAGCHVFVDKPAAMSVREMDRMMAAAKKAGKVFTVHQSSRAVDNLRFIRELIDSKLLGKVHWIKRSGLVFYRRNDWQMIKKHGGGMLNNAGVHHIDSVLTLLDAPVKDVWGDLKHTGVCVGDADDFARVSIRSEDGRLIEIEMSYACPFHQPHWLVCGNYGSMLIENAKDGKAKLKYFDPKKTPKRTRQGAVPQGRKYRMPEKLPWVEKTVDTTPGKPYGDFYENLYKAIRRGAKPLVTAESVRLTTWVMDQVRKSSQWGA